MPLWWIHIRKGLTHAVVVDSVAQVQNYCHVAAHIQGILMANISKYFVPRPHTCLCGRLHLIKV